MNITETYYVTSGPIMEALNQQKFEKLIPAYILTLIVILVGLPGNIITVFVYLRKMRRTVSRTFILALAFCDLTNCILTMPVEIVIILNYWSFDYPALCATGRGLTYILNGISALLLIGIAVDRFRKICRPLKPVFTPKETRSICLVSCALGTVVYIPGFVLYGTRTEHIPLGTKIVAVGKTCLISDRFSRSVIQDLVLVSWFVLTLGVMVILIVIYCRIGKALYTRGKLDKLRKNSILLHESRHKSKRNVDTNKLNDVCLSGENNHDSLPLRHTFSELLRKGRSSTNARHNDGQKPRLSQNIRVGRSSLMLFSVTIAYILSFIPFIIIIVIRTATGQNYYSTLTNLQQSMWDFFLRSYILNCAVNPVLYGFFNKEFRGKMIELFGDCCLVRGRVLRINISELPTLRG